MKRFIHMILVLTTVFLLMFAAATLAEASELKSGIGVVTASSLRLRSEPSTESEIVDTANYGDTVVVIRRTGDWYYVNYNLKTGYMHKDYLSVQTVAQVKLGYAAFEQVTNVRMGPGLDTPVATTAPFGETCFIVGFHSGWYKVSFNGTPGYVRSDLVTLTEKPYGNSSSSPAPAQKPQSAKTSRLGYFLMPENEKLEMIYGTSSILDHRLVYATEEEAASHMTDVLVYTWDIDKDGNKYTRSWLLTVHKKIAPTVEAIFKELYELPEKPPIHNMGGFRWDYKSEHSVGLAIDMNSVENYYCDPNGNALTAGYFRPGKDPYSFPINGSVDKVFAKYGFTRGIYWSTGFKDYMHYSFFGT